MQQRPSRLPLLIVVVAVIAVLGAGLAALRVAYEPEDGLRATPATTAQAPRVVRHDGVDRYGTSTAAALAAYPEASSAVLATGEDFPDGLAAQALAGSTDGGVPFFLTPREQLPAATLAALRRLGVAKVVIVGTRQPSRRRSSSGWWRKG